jgi:hypothetical protein
MGSHPIASSMEQVFNYTCTSSQTGQPAVGTAKGIGDVIVAPDASKPACHVGLFQVRSSSNLNSHASGNLNKEELPIHRTCYPEDITC